MDRLQDHDKTIHCNVFIQHRLNNSITAHRFSLHDSLLSPTFSYCHTTQFESHPYARHLNATTSTVRRDTLSMDCSKNYRIMIQVIADDILSLIDRALIPESGIRAHFWLSGSM